MLCLRRYGHFLLPQQKYLYEHSVVDCQSPSHIVNKSRLWRLKIVYKELVIAAVVAGFTLDHTVLTAVKQYSLTYVSETTGLQHACIRSNVSVGQQGTLEGKHSGAVQNNWP